VTYSGRDYRVTFVDPYTAYGAGFVRHIASCWNLTGERQLSNDSTTAGYLTPVGDSPPYDEDLERLISRWIRGVTGLDATLVYPRWTDPQKPYPKTAPPGARSVSPVFRKTSTRLCAGRRAPSNGHETVSLILCFYGPQGLAMATRFRDGLLVAQNNDELNRSGLTFLQHGRILNLPNSSITSGCAGTISALTCAAKSSASTAFNRWSTRQCNFWRLKHGTGLTCFQCR
jgi:hypothetical protein